MMHKMSYNIGYWYQKPSFLRTLNTVETPYLRNQEHDLRQQELDKSTSHIVTPRREPCVRDRRRLQI